MSWITPTTIWTDSDTPQPSDFNRIEGNTDYLKDSVDNNDSDILSNASTISTHTSEIASSGASVTVLNGTGTPQGVGTTNSPTFAAMTVNSGAASAHYTGSTTGETTLPIGSIVLVNAGTTTYDLNADITVYYSNGSPDEYVDSGTSAMTGTWKTRGLIENNRYTTTTINYYLAQRTV